jgi:hypothetical protein
MVGERRGFQSRLNRRQAPGERFGRGEIRIGETDHLDIPEGQQPIEMDPRGEPATGNPDPER